MLAMPRGKRTVDAILVLVCLALTVLAAKTPWSALPLPVVIAAGVAGSLAQWGRSRRPQAAAVLGAAALTLSGNPGPWLVGVYSGARYAPRSHLPVVAVAGWAGLVAYLWLDSGRLRAIDIVAAVVGTALVVIAGVYLATRQALLVSLEERTAYAEAQRLLRDEQARTAERTRIAREMHDVLAHKVSLIALHAGALELGAGTDPDRCRQAASLIRVTAREALQELRTVLGVLNNDTDRPASTLDAGESLSDLTSLVDQSTSAGQRVELHDRAGTLPPATARVVYRVAQEGLTNAHRYAPGATTTVTLDRVGDDAVTIVVRNTPGIDVPADLPGSGSGLVGLAERIRLVGGALESGPLGPDGRDGWQLRATVPWEGGQ